MEGAEGEEREEKREEGETEGDGNTTHNKFNMRELHGVCKEGREKGERVGHGPETYVCTIIKLYGVCEWVAIG